MNLSLLSNVCQQAKELNSQDEETSSHTQTPASSPFPSPSTHDKEPHPSNPDIPQQNTGSATSQPISSCVITGHSSQESKTTESANSSKENSVEPPPTGNNTGIHSQESNMENNDTAQSSAYANSEQSAMATYLSNGSLVYFTMQQGSLQYVIPQQGGYMIQDPSTGAVTGDSSMQYLQAGQLIQGPDGMQYLAVQNNVLPSVPQSHNLAYIQMENGEQQLCVRPSLEELLSQVDPSEFM